MEVSVVLYLSLAKVTRSVSPHLGTGCPPQASGNPAPSPPRHSPQEVLAEPVVAMKRLKPFSYSFHPGAPFDSEQAGCPLEPSLLGTSFILHPTSSIFRERRLGGW